jgi:hypothetical protein
MAERERRFTLAFAQLTVSVMGRLTAKGLDVEAAFRRALNLIVVAGYNRRKAIMSIYSRGRLACVYWHPARQTHEPTRLTTLNAPQPFVAGSQAR